MYSLTELRDATTPFQKARCVHNLDDLPFPDWDQMPPCEYPPYGMGVIYKKRPVGVIMTSRGCSAKCKFCSSTNFYGVGVRFRSPENVVDEIQYLKERFGIKEFQFYDDNVILKRSHIERICRITLERNINLPWMLPNGIRADCVDNELAKLMKKSGCYYSGLGIESANDNILKNIEKNESVAVMSQAIKTLERNGIDTGGFFILGLPGETKTTLQNTINFAVNSALSFANFYKFTVLPGCEFWKELDVKMESFYKKTYEGGYVPEGLCKKDLDDARFSAYIKFFLRPRAIVKFLKYFHFVQIKYLLRRMFDFGLLPKKNKK
ncbi:MAG: hypothetical protein Ta2B_25110 [Termitinemataceae bacterium]|nr:MAG: hypothetical protein Ta2B_25110 [Termitinemataceae bacterium]